MNDDFFKVNKNQSINHSEQKCIKKTHKLTSIFYSNKNYSPKKFIVDDLKISTRLAGNQTT